MKRAIALATESYNKWSEHQAPRLGASVAFYSVLSFAPLLILITAVIALAFGQASAQQELVHVARQWIGDKGAETVESLLKNAQKPSSGIIATVIAFATLLFGASGVFTELHDALNVIWEVKPKTDAGVMGFVKDKLFSFGMVLSVGFLLLVSLVLSAGLALVGKYFGNLLPMPAPVLQAINLLVSLAVVAVLFGLMFKYVPNATVAWRDVIVGAIGTALLFTIGKYLLGMYLGKASVGSPYGAAGSLVAVVVWIYYSAQIFFFGAEFTHAYAARHASGAKPPTETVESAKHLGVNAGSAEKSRAAAAGSFVPQPIPTVPREGVASPSAAFAPRVSTAAHVISQELAHIHKENTPVQKPAARVNSESKGKPQLLMAVGLGFALGRVFDLVSAKERGQGQTPRTQQPGRAL